MKYSTLKKEYSISAKDYITLGITPEGLYVVVCDDVPLCHPTTLDRANDTFYYFVNKI
jgi:hypothetical protein